MDAHSDSHRYVSYLEDREKLALGNEIHQFPSPVVKEIVDAIENYRKQIEPTLLARQLMKSAKAARREAEQDGLSTDEMNRRVSRTIEKRLRELMAE